MRQLGRRLVLVTVAFVTMFSWLVTSTANASPADDPGRRTV